MIARPFLAAAALIFASRAFAGSIPPLPDSRTPLLLCYTLPMAPDRQTVRLSRGFSLLDVQAELFTVTAEAVTVQTWQVQEEDRSTSSGLDRVYTGDSFSLEESGGIDDDGLPHASFHMQAGAQDVFLDCSDFGGIIH